MFIGLYWTATVSEIQNFKLSVATVFTVTNSS